jgi:ABC-type lipoprotein export system ATPase subunit
MSDGIACRNVSVVFRTALGRENAVLNDIQAEFPPGQLTLVGGRTGAGKSTLLHVLSGLMRPTQGEVLVGEQRISRWIGAHRDRWRRQVGIVFQSHHLLRDLTVLENVLVPMIPRNTAMRRCRQRALELMEQLGIAQLAAEPVRSLSGGERQRVSVARALVSRPAFVFADEPTAHQDGPGIEAVLRVLDEALERKAVVVVAAHHLPILENHRRCRRYRLESGTLKVLP